MGITTKFKTSKPTAQSWSSIFGYRPESAADQRSFGELFCVITLSADVDFEGPAIGSFILDQLQASYFEPTTKTVDILHFEKSVLSVRDFVQDLLSREANLAELGLDIEMAIAAIKGEVLYVGVVGESKIMISREDEFAEISSALIDPDSEGFLRSGSLFTQAGDCIVLTTSTLYEQHTLNTWKESSKKFNLEDLISSSGAALLIGNSLPTTEPVTKVIENVSHTVPQQSAQKSNNPEQDIDVEQEEEYTEDVDYNDNVPYNEEQVEPGPSMFERIQGFAITAREKLFMPKNKYDDEDELEAEEYIDDEKYQDENDSELTTYTDEAGDDQGNAQEEYRSKPVKYSSVSNPTLPQKIILNSQNILAKARRLPVGKYFVKAKNTALTSFYTIDNLVAGVGNKGKLSRNRKPNVKFWSVVAVISILIVGFGIRSVVLENQKNSRIAEIEKNLTAQEQKFSTQLSIRADRAALVANAAIEKEKVAKELDLLKADINKVITNPEATTNLTSRAQSLLTSINNKQDNMLGIKSFTQIQLVSDLAVSFATTNPTDIAFAGGKLYIPDKARNTIYQLDLNLNSTPLEFVTGLVSPYLITVNKDSDLVIADQNTDSALATITVQNKNIKRHPGLSLASVGELASIYVWDNNAALYSLSKPKQSVFKQDSIAGNYQLTNNNSPWRNDADFGNATDLHVDGSLYVLVKGKGLKRYFGGEAASVTINGLTSTDVAAVNSATAFDLNGVDLFIADSNGKRVLHFVLDETNTTAENAVYTYVDQFSYKGTDQYLNNIKEIVYSPTQRNLFILDGTKVIRLDV